MPPNTWDHPTFAAQQSDIDEISAALPIYTARINHLRSILPTLPTTENNDTTTATTTDNTTTTTTNDPSSSSRSSSSSTEISREAAEAEIAKLEAQVRGRLLMARECEEANRRMMECVCVEFLTRGEREVLGGLRVKLARILGEFGE